MIAELESILVVSHSIRMHKCMLTSFSSVRRVESVDASFDLFTLVSVYKTSLELQAGDDDSISDLEEKTSEDTMAIKIYDQYEIGRGSSKVVYKVCTSFQIIL